MNRICYPHGAGPFTRMPGLYRQSDLRQIVLGGDDYRVAYAETSDSEGPLFIVFRRPRSAGR